MPFRIKLTLAVLLSLLVVILVVPFMVPVPPLQDTVAATTLADPDSRFITVNDLSVHYKQQGDPEAEITFILLHGFGASLFSWQALMPELAEIGRVIAFDRPAFGLTSRPLAGEWRGVNPYSPEAQVALTIGLMDALDIEQAVLVGNSAGGTIAVQTALAHPERIDGLVLVNAAIYQGGGAPAWIRPLLHTPQMNRLGPLFMRQIAEEPGLSFIRSAWSDPEQLSDATIAGYRKPLQVHHWDKALWELTKASRRPNLSRQLPELALPALVIAGGDDQIVPPQLSERLASELPAGSLVTLEQCGHVPQEECPEAVMIAIRQWHQQRRLSAVPSFHSVAVIH
jgi:pimeloyl-ACP methyl ester carboxylesterase